MLPRQITHFVEVVSSLPSIGMRQATRLAFALIGRGKGGLLELAKAIADLQSLKLCDQCFFVHSEAGTRCSICSNPARKKNSIMIVEKETDLISLERPGRFMGRYLVLGELKKNGILDPSHTLRLNHLKDFIRTECGGQAEEIILAMNPTTYGDLNAALLTRELRDVTKRITRLGRGIPTGGEIEFADEDTLGQALERRV